VYGSDDSENWKRIKSGIVYRYNKENKNNIIDLSGSTNRYLKLIIYNQDDPPLKIEDMSIKREQQFIFFPAKRGERYYLFYGNPYAKRPIYEFEQLHNFTAPEKSIMLPLGKEDFNKDFSRIKVEIKGNEIVLMWPVVAFVVIALGFLIVESLKKINEKREREKKQRWKKK
jgi:hypothetical protein